MITDEGNSIVIGKIITYNSDLGISKDLQTDDEFSVATATKKAAKMARKQIKNALK